MHIINHVKGKDYEAYVVGDVIKNIESYEPHSWYTKFRQNYNFKGNHKDYILRQYEANREVLAVSSQITEEIKLLLGSDWLPSDARASSGVQELRHEERNSQFTGAVPPHLDPNHHSAFTIFLNKHWEAVWGGWNYILSSYENRVVLSTVPQYNVGVLIVSPTLHGACPVWTPKNRRTLQIFYTREK